MFETDLECLEFCKTKERCTSLKILKLFETLNMQIINSKEIRKEAFYVQEIIFTTQN